jgi:hypothetical protein
LVEEDHILGSTKGIDRGIMQMMMTITERQVGKRFVEEECSRASSLIEMSLPLSPFVLLTDLFFMRFNAFAIDHHLQDLVI